jgi:hypothetical protein
MPLSFWRQNGFFLFIARHEVPGAISFEERFAGGSTGFSWSIHCPFVQYFCDLSAYFYFFLKRTRFFLDFQKKSIIIDGWCKVVHCG